MGGCARGNVLHAPQNLTEEVELASYANGSPIGSGQSKFTNLNIGMEISMRLISYRDDSGLPGVGVMIDDESFVALPKVAPDLPRDLRALIEMGDGFAKAAAAAKGRPADLRLSDVVIDPVIVAPNAIWGVGLNYQHHRDELKDVPDTIVSGLENSERFPLVYLRHVAGHVGHLQPILCPDPSQSVRYDYEGELAVIIGKGGRHIPVERALEHVAGYSIYNDGSVREYQMHNHPTVGTGKAFEQAASFGPWLVTPDEFGVPSNQRMTVRINGIERQDSTIDLMIHDIPHLISYLSEAYFLRAGDVISTGSPGYLPPRPDEAPAKDHGDVHIPGMYPLKPGDVCETEITGIGTLRNTVVADLPPTYQTERYVPVAAKV